MDNLCKKDAGDLIAGYYVDAEVTGDPEKFYAWCKKDTGDFDAQITEDD